MNREIIGFVTFETDKNPRYVRVLVNQENRSLLYRNKFVIIESTDGLKYFGRVIDGPYDVTEDVSISSAITLKTVLHGKEIDVLPRYYSIFIVELLKCYSSKAEFGLYTRPCPKSPVYLATPQEILEYLSLIHI